MSITTTATPGITAKFRAHGFTLTELTIVLVIVALLIGGLMLPLSAQREVQNINETKRQLAEIKEALLGFAAANGRLPCPAAPPNSTDLRGVESLKDATSQTGGECTNPLNGYLPAITLGIGPTDKQGYAIDAWNNQIRYAVTTGNGNAFTTTDGIKTHWPLTESSLVLAPDLRVCTTSNQISGNNCLSTGELTRSAVTIIVSTGPNGATTPTSSDELVNWDSQSGVFVNAEPSDAFDDIVTWISPNILYSRLISAGKLP